MELQKAKFNPIIEKEKDTAAEMLLAKRKLPQKRLSEKEKRVKSILRRCKRYLVPGLIRRMIKPPLELNEK
eukprot:8563221-Ditylum_brightwellii.AAC.1